MNRIRLSSLSIPRLVFTGILGGLIALIMIWIFDDRPMSSLKMVGTVALVTAIAIVIGLYQRWAERKTKD